MSDILELVSREHKLASKLGPIFVVSPELKIASSRLAEYVGTRFIGAEGPLLIEMLVRAVERYREARKHRNQEMSFLEGLFEYADRLYLRRHVAKTEQLYDVWLPMIEPVTQFEGRNVSAEIVSINEKCPDLVTRESAALQMAARTLTGELFRLFIEEHYANHSQAHREALAY